MSAFNYPGAIPPSVVGLVASLTEVGVTFESLKLSPKDFVAAAAATAAKKEEYILGGWDRSLGEIFFEVLSDLEESRKKKRIEEKEKKVAAALAAR